MSRKNLLAIITVSVLEIILKCKHIKFPHYFVSLKQLNTFFSNASGHGNTKHSTENTYLAYENYFDYIKIYFLMISILTLIDHQFDFTVYI